MRAKNLVFVTLLGAGLRCCLSGGQDLKTTAADAARARVAARAASSASRQERNRRSIRGIPGVKICFIEGTPQLWSVIEQRLAPVLPFKRCWGLDALRVGGTPVLIVQQDCRYDDDSKLLRYKLSAQLWEETTIPRNGEAIDGVSWSTGGEADGNDKEVGEADIPNALADVMNELLADIAASKK